MEIKVTGEIKLTADTALLDVLDRLTRLQLANVGTGPITPAVEENATQTASEPQNIKNTKSKASKKKEETNNVKSTEESAESGEKSIQKADESAHGSGQTGDTGISEPVSSADVSDTAAPGDIAGDAVGSDNSADNSSGDADSKSDKSDVPGTVTAEPEAQEPQPERKPVTMAMLRSNILPLVQTGKQPELKALLDKYNVKAVTALPREVWEDFAEDMRKLGAKI